jgi:hypothetical protein
MDSKYVLFLSIAAIAPVARPTMAAEKKTPDQIFISAEAAEAMIESDYKMNPEKAASPRKLREYLQHRQGGPNEISVAEFQAISKGKPDLPRPQPRKPLCVQVGKAPPDTLTLYRARKRFEAKEQLNRAEGKDKPTARDYEKRLLALAAPGATWFTMNQVRIAEKYEFLEASNEKQRHELLQEQANYSALKSGYDDIQNAEEARQQGIRFPRIRRSWRDVLYDEDQSQPDRQGKAIGDLQGALFSYARNGIADTDTWNAHGAVIVPITYNWHTGSAFALRQFALAPSVTFDRVTSSGDSANEVDSLFYRAGLYMEFSGVHYPKDMFSVSEEDVAVCDEQIEPAFFYDLQVRAAGVYVTDEDHRAGLSGYEMDLEPRFRYGNLALGYKINVWKKKPARSDFKDNSFLEAQLRVWLHTEGGNVQDGAPGWTPLTGSFFRLGPTGQFTLAAPALPGHRMLSLTAVYSYLLPISGPSDHAGYFRATLAYDLFRDVELNHKVGIAASYERGGLNFTKQEVDTFTVGLNVLY